MHVQRFHSELWWTYCLPSPHWHLRGLSVSLPDTPAGQLVQARGAGAEDLVSLQYVMRHHYGGLLTDMLQLHLPSPVRLVD